MKQKTVIVTGAAGGLGSALVLEAVRAGWNTVMVDNNRRALEQAYDRAEQEVGGNAVLFPADLEGAGPDDYDTMLASIISEFGGLTALVHCAARFDSLTPIEHISPADWLGHMQGISAGPPRVSARGHEKDGGAALGSVRHIEAGAEKPG